jgi:thiamine-phosphate pyrophosphorylase
VTPLYPILDRSCFANQLELLRFATTLMSAGATLIQYRNKWGSARAVLSDARELRRIAPATVRLIMNDRADLCLAAEFDGVHIGQDDLSPAGARRVVGAQRWVGVSTHRVEQVRAADSTGANYIAIGPVFATTSKQNPDPVVGLEGVRAARAATSRPLVAIGGITRANCAAVRAAGADCVAVISDLLRDPAAAFSEFLRVLR